MEESNLFGDNLSVLCEQNSYRYLFNFINIKNHV